MKSDHQKIALRYGKERFFINLRSIDFSILDKENNHQTPLNDVELLKKLEKPINSSTLDEILLSDDKVLIVIPDATRFVGVSKIAQVLLKKLKSMDIINENISFMIGGGIHREPKKKEINWILGEKIARDYKIHFHDANCSEELIYVGETRRGTKVKLNRRIVEASRIILIGGISFHYIAGFSGGRKGILPGCGAETTIQQNHKLAFDKTKLTKSKGVSSGNLRGNPVSEDMIEAVSFVNPSFLINTVINNNKEIVDVFAGHWLDAHLEGCKKYRERNSVKFRGKRPLVIVSPGGYPKDTNMIQSHKAMEHASIVLEDGGTMILVAKCPQGLGRADFLDWFVEGGSNGTAKKLLKNYKVYGQTAWGISWKSEKFRVKLVSSLDKAVVKQMGLEPYKSVEKALKDVEKNSKGYVIPYGLSTLPIKI